MSDHLPRAADAALTRRLRSRLSLVGEHLDSRRRTGYVARIPDRLAAAARDILDRVKTGLDIPSRREVHALAERLESIDEKLRALETQRAARLKEAAVVDAARTIEPSAATVARTRSEASKPESGETKKAAPKSPKKRDSARTKKAAPKSPKKRDNPRTKKAAPKSSKSSKSSKSPKKRDSARTEKAAPKTAKSPKKRDSARTEKTAGTKKAVKGSAKSGSSTRSRKSGASKPSSR